MWILNFLASERDHMALLDKDALGRVVRADGKRIHYLQGGDGKTPVVYVPGLGVWSPHHRVVHEKLSKVSCAYLFDRPGYGWSELGSLPRTIEANARDLNAAFLAAGIDVPAVIAGHSYGGLVALSFAVLFPGKVKAIILVDSAHPDQWQRFPPAIGSLIKDRPPLLYRQAALAAVGQFEPTLDDHRYSMTEPADEAAVLAATAEPGVHVAMASELENADAPPDVFPLKSGKPIECPVTVLTAKDSFFHFIPDRESDLFKACQREWMALQSEYLSVSRQSQHAFSEGDHALHVSDPDSIVAAFKTYLE